MKKLIIELNKMMNKSNKLVTMQQKIDHNKKVKDFKEKNKISTKNTDIGIYIYYNDILVACRQNMYSSKKINLCYKMLKRKKLVFLEIA